eukprot:gene40989-49999_t
MKFFLVLLLAGVVCTQTLMFLSRYISLPAPYKNNAGEDAYFLQGHDLGVFDGVGGWTEEGIDSGIYSRTLANCISSRIAVDRALGSSEIDIKNAVSFASDECKARNITGSCTACIASLDSKSSVMTVYNLGDSGLLLLRKGGQGYSLVYKSASTYHDFNTPYQLGFSAFESDNNLFFDSPSAGTTSCLHVQEGDIVVLGSDGLWDNLYDEEIISTVNSFYESFTANDCARKSLLQAIIDVLVDSALDSMANSRRQTPWSDALRAQMSQEQQLEAKKTFSLGTIWSKLAAALFNRRLDSSATSTEELIDKETVLGGKEDDITVIISLIVADTE